MAKVFNNHMVAHVWAQQSQPEGRSHNGNFYFEGATLFSYGRHFPVGRFVQNARGERAVILNSDSYSVSTRRHQSYAASAVLGLGLPIFHTPGARADDVSNLEHYRREAASMFRSAKRARKDYSIRWRLNRGEELVAEARAYAAFFDLGEFTWNGSDAEIEALRERAEAAEAEARRIEAASRATQRERDREAFQEWKRGERANAPWGFATDDQGSAYLRVNGDQLETSRGASVPLAHAVKAFRFIRRVREAGKEWRPNGHTLHVGHFDVTRITPEGHIQAGCHWITWPHIEAAAIAAGVFEVEPA